jgi:hypothetical protein
MCQRAKEAIDDSLFVMTRKASYLTNVPMQLEHDPITISAQQDACISAQEASAPPSTSIALRWRENENRD